MITPHFTVRQDDNFVYVNIKVTHLKAQNVEIRIEENIFVLSLPPYYLRLKFPSNIVDDDRAVASFDFTSSLLKVHLPKETSGEYFPDLDLTTKLLARVGESSAINMHVSNGASDSVKKPLIEEVASIEAEPEMCSSVLGEFEDASAFDWQINQEVPTDSLLSAKYGFNCQYSKYLVQTKSLGNDINDLEDPESSTAESRTMERIENENLKFDPEYYLSDKFDNPSISELINFEASLIALAKSASSNPSAIEFTEKERNQMVNLPRRTYLIESISEKKNLYLGLIPILYAYSYDVRTTLDDHTSESAWTIGKLAANISCLDSIFSSVKEVKIACIRRALAYPLYRHWELAIKCWEDVYILLRGGKRIVLKALLKIDGLFSFHDVYYVYSKIITEDYCVWVQSAR
ncbi:SHQ1 protein-domain-containing protein [Dipodascopsis uninucleata]